MNLPANISRHQERRSDRIYIWFGRYWLPVAFFIFLTGLFWLPERHDYKVLLNQILLLPAFLMLSWVRLWPALGRGVRHLFPVIAYLVYFVLISLFRGHDEATDYAKWTVLVLVFLFGTGIAMQATQIGLGRMLATASIVAAIAVAYTVIMDWKELLELASHYRLTGYGTLYNPLRTGHLLGVFAVIAVWSCWRKTTVCGRTWPMFIAASICTFGVMLTGSRAPVVALVAVAAWHIVMGLQGKRRWQTLCLLSGAMVALFLGFHEQLLMRGFSYRPEIWIKSVMASFPHIWFGNGLGEPLIIDVGNGLVLYDTHNVLLATLYFGGIIGLLLFVLAFGRVLAFQWQGRHDSPMLGLAFSLQLYGLLTLQFDGGSLIGRPTEFWHLYWLPMVVYLNVRFGQDTDSEER